MWVVKPKTIKPKPFYSLDSNGQIYTSDEAIFGIKKNIFPFSFTFLLPVSSLFVLDGNGISEMCFAKLLKTIAYK